MYLKKTLSSLVAAAAVVALFASNRAQAGGREDARVLLATAVLTEIMAIPERSVPPQLLSNAHAVAIIPGVVKAGLIFGGRFGKGIMVVRTEDGGWSNPNFITLMGGSAGWQVGVQSTDVLLVFKSIRSLEHIASGKFTLGADASIAAGPVGRHAEAAADVQVPAEVYSYSKSRGLFAGVALEGASLQIDYGANAAYYNVPGLLPIQIFKNNSLQAPASANGLKRTLATYSRK